jgi:large subunit ribosomal protein L17
MRHHNKTKKFGREKDQRKALMRSLVRSLILKGRITTTETKAKALRPLMERFITKARKNDLVTRRLIISQIGSIEATRKLIEEIAPKYESRPGGYTRIVKLGNRESDASPMAIIEFVE